MHLFSCSRILWKEGKNEVTAWANNMIEKHLHRNRVKVHWTFTLGRNHSTFCFRTPNTSYAAYTRSLVCRIKCTKEQVADAGSEFCLQLHAQRYTSKNCKSVTGSDIQKSAWLKQSAGIQAGTSSIFWSGHSCWWAVQDTIRSYIYLVVK